MGFYPYFYGKVAAVRPPRSAMRLILRYLRPHTLLALLAPFCVLLEVWAELEQPALMADIVDRGILGGRPDVLRPTCVKMVIIMLLGLVGGLLSIYAAGRVAYSMGAAMRSDLYARIVRLPAAEVDRLGVAPLITRLGDDVSRIQQVVQACMRLLFRAPFLFCGALVMALGIDASLTGVVVSVMLASFLLVVSLMRRAHPLFLRLQSCRDALASVLRETLVAIRVVKLNANEDLERRRFDQGNEALVRQAVGVGRLMAGLMPLLSFAINMGIVLIVYFGAERIGSGHVRVGGVMAAINYMAQVQVAFMMVSRVIVSVTKARASLRRIAEVFSLPADGADDAVRGGTFVNGDVVFSHVSFSYAGAGLQLSDVSFVVPRGKTVAVWGDVGSGKSTIVSLLARLYAPRQGRITIGGRDLGSLPPGELRSHVAVVLQTPTLFRGTIGQNIAMARPGIGTDKAWEAAEAASVADFVRSLPGGLDAAVEQGGRNLSGGQRQRLCLARALAAEPDILVLDDATASVDAETESRIWRGLLSARRTTLFVSQRMELVARADSIVVLSAGRVVAVGRHERLMSECPIYRDAYLAQQ